MEPDDSLGLECVSSAGTLGETREEASFTEWVGQVRPCISEFVEKRLKECFHSVFRCESVGFRLLRGKSDSCSGATLSRLLNEWWEDSGSEKDRVVYIEGNRGILSRVPKIHVKPIEPDLCNRIIHLFLGKDAFDSQIASSVCYTRDYRLPEFLFWTYIHLPIIDILFADQDYVLSTAYGQWSAIRRVEVDGLVGSLLNIDVSVNSHRLALSYYLNIADFPITKEESYGCALTSVFGSSPLSCFRKESCKWIDTYEGGPLFGQDKPELQQLGSCSLAAFLESQSPYIASLYVRLCGAACLDALLAVDTEPRRMIEEQLIVSEALVTDHRALFQLLTYVVSSVERKSEIVVESGMDLVTHLLLTTRHPVLEEIRTLARDDHPQAYSEYAIEITEFEAMFRRGSPSRAIQGMLREVDTQTLMVALAPYPTNHRAVTEIVKNMSKRAATLLLEDMEYMDRSKFSENQIMQAQNEMLQVFKKLLTQKDFAS